MTNRTPNLLGVELNAHALLATALGAAFVLAGTAARNERAVFLTEGTGLPAKAFTAIIPPASTVQYGPRSGLPGRNYALVNDLDPGTGAGRARPPRSGGAIDNLLTPSSGLTAPFVPLAAPGAAAPTPAAPDPTQLASVSPTQFTPSVLPPSGGGVGGGVPGTTTGTGAPTAPTSPTSPSTPTTPTSPVAAVPESATWEMLLAGFFAIGLALRRREARGPATV